ncbi:LacI family DNA-binding transcriptional regulator [Cerasicoccus maritimus]|uniref:LacI family DNA-binding transcriptional regulator n=1 Tax=Cerasicoccus maritimus TaxID=490089 RepID=UPI00285261ED|nr:LacI family DNA-binding transcriptional regulator [Cerasicoccus maritimus]
MASIKDVAQRAGVSIATVSRMMSNKTFVKEETRERIQVAIDELNYRPNRVAQRLRDSQSHILALIVSDIQNPFFSELARAVETLARTRGYSVFICNTDEDPVLEERYLELMSQEQVAGVIISPSRKAAPKLKALHKLNIPIVSVDRRAGDEFDTVLIDNTEAAQRLTEHVIAGGHQKIAGLYGENSFTAEERLVGFQEALAAHNLSAHEVRRCPAFENEGYDAALAMLSSSNPPDALICSSALLATGAYRAVQKLGLNIPDEVGFACFDDPVWTRCVNPAVTVIRQPTRHIGETAAELLLKRIEEPSRSASLIRLQGELVPRESVREPVA